MRSHARMPSPLGLLLGLASLLALSSCQEKTPTPAMNLDQAMEQLQMPIGNRSVTTHHPNGTISVTANLVSKVEVTSTSVSVGLATVNHEEKPPYALTPSIQFDGKDLRITATTELPDGTLYRLGVQRNIAVKPSPTSTVTGMSTHAGGFIPEEAVDLPEDGLPMSVENFIPQAGRITGGKFVARVQMFPRHVQLFGTGDEPDRYTPNTKEVQVTFAVERNLPGQVKTLTWPKGTERFVWRQMTPCPLPEKTPTP